MKNIFNNCKNLKNTLKRLLLFSPILVIIVGVNYFVDPVNLFHGEQYVKGIANYLLKGKNVTNVYNSTLDERLLQKYFIEKLKECPDIVVLGSSTIFLINSTFFNNNTLINNGVGGASIEDILAIYRLYEKKGFRPNKIILGLDPWLLNDNNGLKMWKTLSLEYFEMLKELGSYNKELSQSTAVPEKWKEIVSISYFKTSIDFLFAHKSKKYFPTDKI